MLSLSKIGEIVMEQLQRDRDYTGFLIRLIDTEIRTNKFKNRDELNAFINKIMRDLNSDEVINYVSTNGLKFDYQAFNMKLGELFAQFDRMQQLRMNAITRKPEQPSVVQQPQVVEQPIVASSNVVSSEIKEEVKPNYKFVPITKIDVNEVSKELIEKINFVIVNPNVDTNDYQVDIASSCFLNTRNNELYYVVKNSNTNTFELINANPKNTEVKQDDSMLSKFKDEDLKTMQANPNVSAAIREEATKELELRIKNNVENKEEKKEVKARTLMMPKINNAAFVSTVLVAGISAISGIVIASLLLVK